MVELRNVVRLNLLHGNSDIAVRGLQCLVCEDEFVRRK